MAFSTWIRRWKRSLDRRWALYQTLRRKAVACRHAIRPHLEILEERFLLSTYTVNSTADDGSAGTLRYAITQANAPGSTITEIDFGIGTSGSAQTISPTSQLPALTANGVFINGLSQGGSGNTTRLITLNGTSAGSSSDGLLLQGSGDSVSGLIIKDFHNGIEISGATDTIGGTTSGAGNILSGNSNDGVLIDSGATGNQVQGNYIGINASGTAQANSGNGVEIAGNNNTIGGTASGARDIISGNSNDGVLIGSGATGNWVMGEFIGISPNGSVGVANIGNGIEVAGTHNTIGASVSTGLLNIISGNSKDGVLLDSTASGTLIEHSYLGININAAALANGANGVEIQGTSNTIGGNVNSNTALRNYISGNSNDGVLLDSGASGNQVQGAFIGLGTSGTNGVANVNGIEIAGSRNTIGGTSSGYTNVLSGNNNDGMLIDSGVTGNLVQGNNVGTNYNATGALANAANGVESAGNTNTIGGSVSGAGNTIAHNLSGGVLVSAGSGNTIRQNSIFANGSANTGPGITLASGANNNLAAPTVLTATVTSGTLTVTGTYNAPTAHVSYVLEFFANPSSDAEGKIYLGLLTVTPTGTGTQNFTFTTTNTSQLGTYPLITATLTDPSGDTSQISTVPSLSVLDLNTGETIPANATLNSFSGWSENLLAQVSGAASPSYSWSLTNAPDFTVSGSTTTDNLQGTWTTFTSGTSTDTISVTETPSVGSPLTVTFSFQLSGTGSPAYSSRPTSSSTWSNVQTPDQLQSQEATQPGGPYASLGLADGSVQTAFTMPSYNSSAPPNMSSGCT